MFIIVGENKFFHYIPVKKENSFFYIWEKDLSQATQFTTENEAMKALSNCGLCWWKYNKEEV